MTTSDRHPLGDAAEADMIDQDRPIGDIDDDTWGDTQRVSVDRDWEASEADLIDGALAIPDDDGMDR